MRQLFRGFAEETAAAAGSHWAFAVAVLLSVAWLVAGPLFRFSDTWQLTMNTVASQVTFLLAFLLQNTQNRDARALQLKLDELLRTVEGARPNLINLEALSDDELDHLQREFERLRARSNRG